MGAIDALRGWVEKAWLRLAGLFSLRQRFIADVLAALERGEGSIVFHWYYDGEDDGEADDGEIIPVGLLADIDAAIRRMPAPLGADEFIINVAVYGPRLQDLDRFEDTPEGRRLLRVERFQLLDRYYDWKRGDGPQRLRRVLEQNAPSREQPLVIIQILPLGGALAALFRSGRWQPASAWLR